jgi:hypothetical protein
MNPSGCRVVALEKSTETEKGQWYLQDLPKEDEYILGSSLHPQHNGHIKKKSK